MGATSVRATQLIAASKRSRLDPFVDVDWSMRPDEGAYYQLPPEKLPLFGTPLWDEMSEERRREYSRHEAAAVNGAGIFFENLAMQTILRHLLTIRSADPSHQYLLIEIAEECKHSIMFGEYVRWLGTPCYSPPASSGEFRPADGLPGRVTGFVLLLAVEELLDVMNRATMADDRVHPVNRACSRIHVLEEARHVSFAKAYLGEMWSDLSDDERVSVREFAPVGVQFIASFLVNGEVYEHLGIPDGEAVARANPHHQQRVADDLRKLVGYLWELGAIDASSERLWVDLGLVAEPALDSA